MTGSVAVACCWFCLAVAVDDGAAETGPYQATGIKIGEVTTNSARIWTRLTTHPTRNPDDAATVDIEYRPGLLGGARNRRVKGVVFADGATVSQLRQAAPGIDGDVRVLYRIKPQDDGDEANWEWTDWRPVEPLRDFTRQFLIEGLRPATTYQVRVESRSTSGEPGGTEEGSFRTAGPADAPQKVVFTVVTGCGNDDQDSPEGFKIYPAMARLDPDFFVHTGDILYYDQLAKTLDLARYHWQRTYSWPTAMDFHRHVASYFEKDDHDTWCNDCWPTMATPFMHEFTFRQGQQIFLEQVPMGPRTYRTFRWGKDLQIWLVEGRDFRSPNDAPDGPDKTIWGAEQIEWFERTVRESDASFRVLISPTPLVGPDRSAKGDNHANATFAHEGNRLRRFLAEQKNMVVLCGDRHWQYFSIDPETKLREYSCGPASDEHAGGWNEEDFRPDIHRFLKVAGGYLAVTVERVEQTPTMTLRFCDVDGNVRFEDIVPPPASVESP